MAATAELKTAVVEKDVEHAYREAIHKGRPDAVITSPHNTDGYARWGTVRLLLEAKYDLDFKSHVPVCNTLGQCLLYIKKFEEAGEPLPNVILVGDKNECFVLSTASVKSFLDLPIDWQVAPSSGSPELTRALVDGTNIAPYVYNVDERFDFRTVLEEVEALAAGEQHSVRATPTNLSAMFTYWREHVFGGGTLTPVEQVDVFLRCLFQPKDVYLHPGKTGVLVVPGYGDGVPVNPKLYQSFFTHFEQGYKPSEVDTFYSMKDRLVEDDARRRQGAFFTPALWVDEAHKTLSAVLGSRWRQDCIVWDPAAGTGNLTRDYDFADLILTTAEKPDVEVIKGQGYNAGAEVAQYDFLNPGIWSPFFSEEGDEGANVLPDSIERKLRVAAEKGKRLVWLMNPPYGTAATAVHGTHKAGIAATAVNGEMKAAKMGACSQQLYAQFMFQCARVARDYGFERWTVATFSVPTFMCSGSYRKFRAWWYGQHECQAAWTFQASHFADVSGRWGVSFTVWGHEPGHTVTNLKGRIGCDLLDVQGFKVVSIGTKNIYNSDGRGASKWVREPLGKVKGLDAPQMSSGLKVKGKGRGGLAPGSMFYFGNNANNLMDSGPLVYFVSSADTRAHGLPLLPSNFRRAVALYGARKLVPEDWTNQKDEYLVPTPSLAYEQWTDDCHVFAPLLPSNNCTAMRDVPYKGKTWTIHNHFFWRTRASALTALDTKDTPQLYRDCKAHPAKDVFGNPVESTPDPYLASLLASGALKLSPEAQRCLDLLDALWAKSLPQREDYAAGKPELHLLSWDSGIYQLKHLWRDLFPEEWEELQEAFKALADRLRPGVYTHGFLLK